MGGETAAASALRQSTTLNQRLLADADPLAAVLAYLLAAFANPRSAHLLAV